MQKNGITENTEEILKMMVGSMMNNELLMLKIWNNVKNYGCFQYSQNNFNENNRNDDVSL